MEGATGAEEFGDFAEQDHVDPDGELGDVHDRAPAEELGPPHLNVDVVPEA